MSEYAKPLPYPTIDTAPYWEYASKHELRAQKCADCGHYRYPPNVLCPKCLSEHASWEQLSGRGTVYTFIVFHRAPNPAFADEVPYAVAIVALEEGPRLLTNIVECPVEKIEIGMPVQVVFEDVTESVALPKFRPSGSSL